MPHSPPILTPGDPSAFTRGKKGGRHGPEEQKRNHGKVRDGSVCEETSRYDSHGVPKPRQTAPKSDHTVRETPQVIKKGERPVKLAKTNSRRNRWPVTRWPRLKPRSRKRTSLPRGRINGMRLRTNERKT